MKLVGKHIDRELYYFDLESELVNLKNYNDWILLLIGNSNLNEAYISNVFKTCIEYGISEFRAQGTKGDRLELLFDLTMVDLAIEKDTYYDISTVNSTDLESAVWECFYTTNFENIKIFCTTSDKADYLNKIQNIFNKIKSGWTPE